MPEARGGPPPFTLAGTICRLEVGWKLDDSARALRFAKRRGEEWLGECKGAGQAERGWLKRWRIHDAGFRFLRQNGAV